MSETLVLRNSLAQRLFAQFLLQQPEVADNWANLSFDPENSNFEPIHSLAMRAFDCAEAFLAVQKWIDEE